MCWSHTYPPIFGDWEIKHLTAVICAAELKLDFSKTNDLCIKVCNLVLFFPAKVSWILFSAIDLTYKSVKLGKSWEYLTGYRWCSRKQYPEIWVTWVLFSPLPAALAQMWIKTLQESVSVSPVVPKHCPPNQTDTKNKSNHMVLNILMHRALQLDTQD